MAGYDQVGNAQLIEFVRTNAQSCPAEAIAEMVRRFDEAVSRLAAARRAVAEGRDPAPILEGVVPVDTAEHVAAVLREQADLMGSPVADLLAQLAEQLAAPLPRQPELSVA